MTKDFLTRPEVKDFIISARQYCEFMESTQESDPIGFLKKTRELLLSLYQKGLTFPLYHGDFDEDIEDMLGERYFVVLDQINKKIGKVDYYSHVYDPSNFQNNKPVTGSLTDDLGDIYRDLKRALLKLDADSENAKEGALWDFHFLFRAHYGEHIINAVYAMHFSLQDE